MSEDFGNAMLEEAEQRSGASGAPSSSVDGVSCPYCERKGLPILPVRYAVCQRTSDNSAIEEIPPGRVAEFTSVGLDKALENGVSVDRTIDASVKSVIDRATNTQVNKYILRQLRPGYFYLFDEANELRWYAYRVTEEGLFEQFRVLYPDEGSLAEFSCPGNPTKSLHASLVTLPSVDSSEILYYAFTEHPWSEEHIKMVGANKQWRDDNMQKVDVKRWVAGSGGNASMAHAYGVEDLEKVAEYGPGNRVVKEHFWSVDTDRKLFTADHVKEVMGDKLSAASSRYQGRGLILAVNDELGVIDELNALRHQSFGVLESFLDQDGENNRRKFVAMQAIDAFKESFRQSYILETDQGYETRAADIDKEKAPFEESLSKTNRDIEAARAAGDESEVRRLQRRKEHIQLSIDMFVGTPETQNEIVRRSRQSREDTVVENHGEELSSYVDEVGLSRFREDYNKKLVQLVKLVDSIDADYAYWLKFHMPAAMNRYSTQDYGYGIGMSGLIVNSFRGGALGPASTSVWAEMAREIDTPESTLRRAMFSNMSDLVEASLNDRGALDDGAFFNSGSLLHWANRYIEKAESLPLVKQEELEKKYQVIMPAIMSIIGNSVSALAVHEKSHVEASGALDALQSFIRYAQLAYMGQAEAQQGSTPLPLLRYITMARGEYFTWMNATVRRIAKEERTPINTEDAIHYAAGENGGVGGNIIVQEDGDETPVSIVKFVEGSEIDHFDDDDRSKRDGDLRSGARSALASSLDKARTPLTNFSSIGLVSYNAVATLVSELGGDNDADSLKVMGAIVSLNDSGMKIIENYAAVRNASLPPGQSGLHFVESANWKIAGQGLAIVSGGLSIISGLKEIGKIGHDRRIGVPDELTHRSLILGGLGIASGIIGIVGVFVLGGPLSWAALILGIVAAVLGYQFVRLVAPAVGIWVDRCIFGHNTSQLARFENLSQELTSLDLVFSGVTVELTWEYPDIATPMPGLSGGAVFGYHTRREIRLSVILPKLDKISCSVTLNAGIGQWDVLTELYSYNFVKDEKTEGLVADESASSKLAPGDDFIINDKDYEYEVDLINVVDSEKLGAGVRLHVLFFGGARNGRKQTLFEMRF